MQVQAHLQDSSFTGTSPLTAGEYCATAYSDERSNQRMAREKVSY